MPISVDEQKLIAELDPYKLRQEALQRRLEPFELGRALFHSNQRRGFKSNRKLDRGNEEAGKVRQAEEFRTPSNGVPPSPKTVS
jgi:CRISPR-associated endonuclease Csn1